MEVASGIAGERHFNGWQGTRQLAWGAVVWPRALSGLEYLHNAALKNVTTMRSEPLLILILICF
ncbi:hypothetical protein CUU62_21170 [Pseudomonas sp. WP001]|nr:hypothetical protein CUU62_21170 [Pseudomonas sp. WP001]